MGDTIKKVCVYTRSGPTSPSSYYRILQYQKGIDCDFRNRSIVPDRVYANYNKSTGLRRKWYQLRFYACAYFRTMRFLLADAADKPDAVFVSRAIMPRICPFPLPLLMKRLFRRTKTLIWDIDDDIFQSREITPKEESLLLRFATHMILVNDHLRSTLPQERRDTAVYLPTTDGDFADEDLEALASRRKQRYCDGEIALLWLATYTSLPFLSSIVPYLDTAAEEIYRSSGKQLVLEVVCNRPLNVRTSRLKIVNMVWSKELAADRIRNAHIGIMPLEDTPHTRGKGGFKLLQYMAIGLATVSSAVGSANDIVTNGENGMLASVTEPTQWTSAVTELAASWERMQEMGMKARKRWEEAYSYHRNLKVLTELLCGETEE